MANGIIVDGISWPTTLPISQADPLIPASGVGALWAYDFGRQLTAAPTNGQSIPNLVRGAPAATVAATGLTLAGGGLDFSASADARPRLSAGLYDLTSRSVLVLVWVRVPATGSPAAAGVLGAATDGGLATANNQFTINTASSGARLTGQLFDNTNTAMYVSILTTDAPLAVHQVAVEYHIGDGQRRTYLNGSLINTTALPAGYTGLKSTNLPLGIGSWNGNGAQTAFKGRIYRTYGENLTASGRTGLSIVQADWTANNGRFS